MPKISRTPVYELAVAWWASSTITAAVSSANRASSPLRSSETDASLSFWILATTTPLPYASGSASCCPQKRKRRSVLRSPFPPRSIQTSRNASTACSHSSSLWATQSRYGLIDVSLPHQESSASTTVRVLPAPVGRL